jgi:hypothetical protein
MFASIRSQLLEVTKDCTQHTSLQACSEVAYLEGLALRRCLVKKMLSWAYFRTEQLVNAAGLDIAI